MSFSLHVGLKRQQEMSAARNPFVHLELHTGNLPDACAFYTRLFGWRAQPVRAFARTYQTLAVGDGLEGGVVECGAERPLWLPYVEVADVRTSTERALGLGAAVLLAPREGPFGWRSVVAEPAGGEVALWQPKD
jgi:predicted enzyme related to lactoylglutathione lyase